MSRHSFQQGRIWTASILRNEEKYVFIFLEINPPRLRLIHKYAEDTYLISYAVQTIYEYPPIWSVQIVASHQQ